MAAHGLVHFLAIVITVTTIFTGGVAVTASPPPVKAAYWPSWVLDFPPSAIDTTHFTHIYYAFLLPSNVTFQFEISNLTAIFLTNFVTTLRHKNPPVKTLYSVGGATVSDPTLFARLTSDPARRSAFIKSSIEVGREFGFDGLDFDWEFPKTQTEMQDLGYLFEEWRAAIDAEAASTRRPPLLLTAAVYFAPDVAIDGVRRSYLISSLSKNLDWASPMTFDYHGGWELDRTGSHAALFDPNSNLSTSYGLRSWIWAGLPPSKIVMGLPLYGRTWELKDPYSSGVGAHTIGLGPGNEAQMTYREVVKFNQEYSARVIYDVDTMSTYSVVGTTWIGYDDAVSITTKVGFAQALGIRGYFFWAVAGDHEWKLTGQASKTWVIE